MIHLFNWIEHLLNVNAYSFNMPWYLDAIMSFAILTFAVVFSNLVMARKYREIDGKLYVKEGFGKWQEITEHLKEHHSEIDMRKN